MKNIKKVLNILCGCAMLQVADCFEAMSITSCDECPKASECQTKWAIDEVEKIQRANSCISIESCCKNCEYDNGIKCQPICYKCYGKNFTPKKDLISG